MQLGRYALLPTLLLLAGCAGAHRDTPTNGLGLQTLAPGVTLMLPDTPPFDGEVEAVQLVQARYHERHEIFQAVIENAAQHFVVTMTVPSGPRIMRIDWSHDSIKTHKEPIAPESLSSARLLADLMLVYASDETLRSAVAGAELATPSKTTRTLSHNGQTLISVTLPIGNAWNGHATLSNYAYDYKLDIQSQAVVP